MFDYGKMFIKNKYVISIALILFICVIWLVLRALLHDDPSSLKVYVQIGDEVVYEAPLSGDVVYRAEVNDGYNVIKIQGGKVCVSEADCPNKVCVNTGYIDKKGDVIACIPHKLIVRIGD